MSYDFMMMKPRPERESEIESLEDLGEHTLQRQDPAALVGRCHRCFRRSHGARKTAAGSVR